MDAQANLGQALDADSAERIAGFLGHQDGVSAVTVATPDGTLLASAGAADSEGEASLAAFICQGAAEITSTDDLRGMGKLVSESAFEQLTVSGPRGEGLVLSLDGGCILVSAKAGQLALVEQSVAPVVSRFGRAPAGRRGG